MAGNFDDSWKQMSLELLVTISENAPPMMRKHVQYLPKIGACVCVCVCVCMCVCVCVYACDRWSL